MIYLLASARVRFSRGFLRQGQILLASGPLLACDELVRASKENFGGKVPAQLAASGGGGENAGCHSYRRQKRPGHPD